MYDDAWCEKPGAKTVTTAVRGVLENDAAARSEILSFIKTSKEKWETAFLFLINDIVLARQSENRKAT